MMQQAWDIIVDMAALFGDVDDMGEMDAADFKDAAGEIWALRERAKNLVIENS